jgi:hypothetical protein
MELQDNFAHWFKTATGIGSLSSEKYKDRISAIVTLTKDIEIDAALDLLRVYCGLTSKDSSTLPNFTKHFQDTDPWFDTRDTPFVFQVLSAISLIQILNGGSSYAADAVSLALLSHTFNGKKKILAQESVSADLETTARNYLNEESLIQRRVDKFDPIKIAASSKGAKLNLKNLKAPAEQTTPMAAGAAHATFTSIFEAVIASDDERATLIKSINASFEEVHKALQVNSEETNIFWWLVSEWSRDLHSPYKDLSTSEACIVAGKELADLTVFIPGHNSAMGFLSRILKLTKDQTDVGAKQKVQNTKAEFSIKEVINDTPEKWNKEWLDNEQVKGVIDFCPLHFALSKRIELGAEGWDKLFASQIGIKPATALKPYEMSYQFYQERLLVRASA